MARTREWVEAAGWVVQGALVSTGFVSMLTIGRYFVLVAVALAVALLALARWQPSWRIIWLVLGWGAGPGLVIWVSLSGPQASVLEPRPWLVLAAGVAVAGLVAALVTARTARPAQSR